MLLPPVTSDVEWAVIEDFWELTDMLQERARRWPEKWKQEGRLEGEASGQRRAILRQTQKRYGAEVAAIVGVRLTTISDPQRLEELAEAFLDCHSSEAWLDRVALGATGLGN